MLTDWTSRRPARDRAAPLRRTAPAPRRTEPARADAPGQRLFGRLADDGFCVTWHDFTTTVPLDWRPDFAPDTAGICLNLDGLGRIEAAGRQAEFGPLSAGFCCVGAGALSAVRKAGGRHRFVTVTFTRDGLARQLADHRAAVHPLIREAIAGPELRSGVGAVQALTPAQRQLALGLRQPPVTDAALGLWYRCKAHELVAQFFFQTVPGENFCTRQNRLADERVRKVIARLRANLTEPPPLKALGREAGCSPFHLSRIFSRHTGLTIPQYLRHLRLHRAAELLRAGRHNVTEAAMEVGYSSLSHFSLAFHETFGCCPGLYPWGSQGGTGLRPLPVATVLGVKGETGKNHRFFKRLLRRMMRWRMRATRATLAGLPRWMRRW